MKMIFHLNNSLKKIRLFRKSVVLKCVVPLTLFSPTLSAEIVLDGTLGAKMTLEAPHFMIRDTMGQQVGNNLFHSFETFNINTGEIATFTGSDSIANVISRVTGNQTSFINGVLQSKMPNADMYFLNPNGIMFGEHAALDVQSSFYVSTANTLYLGNNGRFDASTPSQSILTTAPPEKFGFLDNSPSPISIQSSFLQVPTEKTLSILSGNLLMQNATLYARDGQINLVSMADVGEIGLDLSNTSEKLGTMTLLQSPDVALKKVGDTEITNIDTSGATSGQIFIQSGQFLMTGGRVSSQVLSNDISQPQKLRGNITIDTQAMTLENNSFIDTNTFELSDGGDINITATKNLTLKNNSGISVASSPGNTGNAGNLNLTVGQLTMQDKASLNSGTLGSGQGGNITITANQDISIKGKSLIASSSGNDDNTNSNHGGEIHIIAPHLEIKEFSEIQTATSSQINGDAGKILLEVDHLKINHFGQILAPTLGNGTGGNIVIDSIDIAMNNGFIISEGVSQGDAGLITLTTNQALLTNGSIISTSGFQANGGDIFFKIHDKLTMIGESGLAASTYGNGTGGDINVDSHAITMTDEAVIVAGSLGEGNAGSISLTTNTASITQGSAITTQALQARGGNIAIRIHDQLDLANSFITAEAGGDKLQDSGGNLTIDKPHFFTANNSQLLAKANAGNGGNIKIIAEYFIKSADSLIDASSQLGIDGKIEIISVEEELIENFTVLSSAFFDATKLLPKRCAERFGTNVNSFTIRGTDTPVESPNTVSVHIPSQLLTTLFGSGASLKSNQPNSDWQTNGLFIGCRYFR